MQHFVQKILTLCGFARNGFPLRERDGKVFDQLSVPAQRFHSHKCPFAFPGHRGGEDLFCRHVRNVIHSGLAIDRTGTLPVSLRNQRHREVRPIAALIAQAGKALGIEPGALFLDPIGVSTPGIHRVFMIRDPDRAEYGVIEQLHCLFIGSPGEAFSCPGFRRQCGNAPLMPSVDLVSIGLGYGGAVLHDARELFRIQPCQRVRVLGLDKDPYRQILRHLAELFFLPGESLGENRLFRIMVMEPVLPV